MITALSMEFYKIRRRKVGLIVVMMTGVQFLWAFWAMRNMDAYKLSQGWMNSIYLFSQINCIMMPILAAVIGSRLSDIEHKGSTLKLLRTIIPSNRLFIAKFLCGSFYIASSTVLQIGVMIFIAYLRGFTQQFPLGYLSYFALVTIAINLTLLLLQQLLSLLFVNQMIGFIIAIAGTFMGLYSLFFKNAAKFVIWGYYGVLSPVGMNWEKDTRIVNFQWLSVPLGQFIALLIIFILLYIVGKKLFIKKEV